jgi:superfamily II DNA or RNA helicase
MDYQELLQKYNTLLKQVNQLTQENNKLKAKLGVQEYEPIPKTVSAKNTESKITDDESAQKSFSGVDCTSDSLSKILLFMSLFQGREDVYAKRWENKSKGKSGYAPVCLNEWQPGICRKPKISCSKCNNKAYAELNEKVIEHHLRGNTVIGIYPMLPDETCRFLAMDFDKDNWEKDITAVRDVCNEFMIPIAVERSRSGKGCHAWFFFEHPVSAVLARKFATAILTSAMSRRHEIKFKSYDRLFPSQDTMPKGGLGNLIALPLQKEARENANSEFIDDDIQSYQDQWAFLSGTQKISKSHMEHLILTISPGNELGELKIDEEEEKPWETHKPQVILDKSDFPDNVIIVKANMLFLPKAGISQRALNRLKRIASFKNPMFYRHQAMRLPTHNHPRVISCADETQDYLCLPRGCEADLVNELDKLGIAIEMIDKTYTGKPIKVEFKGHLRDEQTVALGHLLRHNTGILSGTTAFGKTIVAIKLIAEIKINTLILVDKVTLLKQWKEKLSEFLEVNESVREEPIIAAKKRGRKKIKHVIGQIGAGKDTSSGIIDIAVMQSLSRQKEVKDCVKNYGLIIADECHHASAFTYEQILKTTPAKYVYGLTATPARKDGHHPILFMQCGPIRYRDNPKKQAEIRPFDHYIIPRFTPLRTPLDIDPNDLTIQALYTEIMENDFRDQLIIEDVLKNHHQGRNCLVLTLRTAHVENLAAKLNLQIPDVISLTGGMGRKSTQQAFERINDIPADKPIVLVATGHFIGEGFDEPRLDTLFLAMPISWKGTLQQYAGRLHRLFKTKKEVKIYDYVDIQIKMLEKMYQKRLSGYASMGYKAKGEVATDAPPDIIFDKDNFLHVFNQDIVAATKDIIIVSPFVRKRRTQQMVQNLNVATAKHIHVTVVTRPKKDFPVKDHPAMQKALELLLGNGLNVIFKSDFHQKFAIMDQKVVWYGSINLLSYGSAQESIMRIESSNIANELIKTIESE